MADPPPNGPNDSPFEVAEAWLVGPGRGCSEPLKRTKLQRNVILADVLLPGSNPTVPWGLGLLSFPFLLLGPQVPNHHYPLPLVTW